MIARKRRSFQGLQRQLQPDEISIDPEVCRSYAGDKWYARQAPEAVALPRSAESVAVILRYANRYRIPVTARGAGYGYVGGCVPSRQGILLSLEQMNRILEINPDDFVAVVEPGVITQTLQEAAEAQNRFYPPDPASRADCSLGGNIATNAGGPRCLKYGVTRDYVLGLEVALADGSIVELGSRTHKNKTGFDMARLFVGSEGMLGIVTKATLKLLPLPPYRASLSAGFPTMREATQAIRAIFAAGFLPAAIEVADSFTLEAARKRTQSPQLEGCDAHLITEVDGHEDAVRSELNEVDRIVDRFDPRFTHRGFGNEECEAVWQIRREFSYSLRDTGLTKLNQDIVVPRSRLEALFEFAAELQRKHDLPIACFGHAGDGNIHVNIMIDETWPNIRERQTAALDELFRQVLEWGGVITGEHGIGLAKKRWWPQAANQRVRKLHRQIKAALDPQDTLNPGKFL